MDPTRLWIAALIYPMANAVMFGAGATLVLAVPYLHDRAEWTLPGVIVLALVLAAPVAYVLAPRLRLRYWQNRETEKAEGFDAIIDEAAR